MYGTYSNKDCAAVNSQPFVVLAQPFNFTSTTTSMRKYAGCFLTIIFSLPVTAQKPEELLTNWSRISPIEKIHLHLDRENYLAGESAWFKAYLYSDYQPDTISTTLYLELVNEESVVLSKKVLPILF